MVFEFGDRTGFTVPIIHLKHKLYSSKAGLLYCIVLLLSFEVRSPDRNLTYGAQWIFETERYTPRPSLYMCMTKKVRSWESISLTETHVRNIYFTKVGLLGFISVMVPEVHTGRDSSVSIATRYGLEGPGIEPRWGRDFPHLSGLALGPIQPPAQWVPDLSRG